MAALSYSGEYHNSYISNSSASAALSGSGTASGNITSVSADVSFFGSTGTFTVTATLSFSNGGSVTASKTFNVQYEHLTTQSFSFSGLSVAQANSITSISVSSSQTATLYADGNVTVTVNYTPPSKLSTPSISVSNTITTSDHVTVSWTESSSVSGNTLTGYTLEYQDGDGTTYGAWTTYNSYGANVRIVGANIAEVNKYRKFRVRATGSAGASYYSDWSISEPVYHQYDPPVPSAPSNFTALPATWESGNISLSWNASSISDGYISNYYIQYNLKRYGEEYGGWTALANTQNTNYLYNPNLSKGDNIQYRVRALSSEGKYSDFSTTATVVRPTVRPINLTPAAGWYRTIDICAWDLPQEIDLPGTICQYSYSTNSGETWTNWETASGNSFSASELFACVDAGQFFSFKVRAVQTNGDVSEPALSGSIYKNTAPYEPIVIAPVPQSPSSPGAFWAIISISANPFGHAMTAAYSLDGGDFVTIASGLTAACSVAVKLTSGGTYTFRITDEYGAYSETQKSITVTTETYTDSIIEPGTTRIKAAHINELRSRIETICTLYGATAPSWSEDVIAGTTSIKNFPAHIAELREAVETIYTVINSKGAGTVIALPSWAAALTDIKPKATAIEELRNAVKEI